MKKFDQKPSVAAFSAVIANFDKCQPEVAGDVILGVALVDVSLDVRAKFSYSRLNSGRTIRLFGRPDPFYAFLYSISLHFAADRKQLA